MPTRYCARLLVLCIALTLAGCGRDSNESSGGGTAIVRPIIKYSPQALMAGNVSVDEALIRVTRSDESIALELTVPFPPDLNTIDVPLSIPLKSDPETVFIEVTLLGQGTLLFSGGSSVDLVSGNQNTSPPITLNYFGPGSNIASLDLNPRDTTIFVGNSFTYDLTAFDGQGLPLALFYATWNLTSANGVTVNANGLVRALAAGGALVTASVPNETQSNFANLRILAAPTAITKLEGDGMVGPPGTAFTNNPLRVGVDAGTQPLGGAPVRWRVLSGGGSVSAPVTNTDVEGVASVIATLGPLLGPNTFEASVNGLTTVFTLTAQVVPTVVFLGQGQSGTTIQETPPGGGPTVLTSTAGGGFAWPRWSANRLRVAYSAVPGAGFNNLWLLDPAVRTPAAIVSDTGTYRPRWNSAGTHLAFSCGGAPFDFTEDVCVILNQAGELMPIAAGIGNGAGRRVLTDGLPQAEGPGVFGWDPISGDSVLVVRVVPQVTVSHSTLYLVAVNGSGFRQVGPPILHVSNDTMRVSDITWAPNGAFAVLVAETPLSPDGALFRINRDGSGLARLTNTGPGFGDRAPSVSPNNSQVCFVRGDLRDGLLGADFFRIGATGGAETQITQEGNNLDGGSTFTLNQYTCDWSPDGQQLVVIGSIVASEIWSVFRVNATTTTATYLTDRVLIGQSVSGTDDLEPSWRP